MAQDYYRLVKHGWGGEEWYGVFGSDEEAIAAFLDVFKAERRRDKETNQSLDEDMKKWAISQGKKYRRISRKNIQYNIDRLGYVKPGVVIRGSLNLPWATIYTIQQGEDEPFHERPAEFFRWFSRQ